MTYWAEEGLTCADEENPAKIDRNVAVVVQERHILLWIQHLQQGRSWISVDSSANLVHFVNKDERVFSLDLLQCLDDLSWHRTDARLPDRVSTFAAASEMRRRTHYVRRCPLISATSVKPPTEKRKNCLFNALAMDFPIEVFPTPGGPTKHKIFPSTVPLNLPTAKNSSIRSLTSCVVMYQYCYTKYTEVALTLRP